MPKESYYKKMFFIGAIWNWIATLTFMLGYKILFPLFGMELPRYPVFLILFLGLAFVFGIGYFWVSRDIYRNHDIIRLGIAGKLFVFVLMSWGCISKQIHMILIGTGAVDLIFAILYLEFLRTYKRSAPHAPLPT
ncbi:MAG: hypothetical protein GY866_41645 [Proteobacteria bacterium]|nr:hypothetical protein [Pseudomonadota bacterium]